MEAEGGHCDSGLGGARNRNDEGTDPRRAPGPALPAPGRGLLPEPRGYAAAGPRGAGRAGRLPELLAPGAAHRPLPTDDLRPRRDARLADRLTHGSHPGPADRLDGRLP